MQPLELQVGSIKGHKHPPKDVTNIFSEEDKHILGTVLGQKLQVMILNGRPEQ